MIEQLDRGMRLARRGPATLAAAALVLVATAGLLATSATAGASTAARAAAAASTDLGPANYEGWCKHLGFVRSQISAAKEWECLHSDGTTSPLDLQAACEFTYPQRPIAAAQLTPGVPYTWQCWAAAPGKVVLPGPGGGGGGASSPLAAAIRRALIPAGRGAKIGALVRSGRYRTSFHAPGLGRLSLAWYYKPRRRHARQTLIASAGVIFARSSTRTVSIALTSKGKRLLKHASRLAVSARGSYTPNASSTVGTTAVFNLRR
jgi:hypothetical protein